MCHRNLVYAKHVHRCPRPRSELGVSACTGPPDLEAATAVAAKDDVDDSDSDDGASRLLPRARALSETTPTAEVVGDALICSKSDAAVSSSGVQVGTWDT